MFTIRIILHTEINQWFTDSLSFQLLRFLPDFFFLSYKHNSDFFLFKKRNIKPLYLTFKK